MGQKCIDRGLSSEIKRKFVLIRNPSFTDIVFKEWLSDLCYGGYQRRQKKAILENAQIHSFSMEHPDEKMPFCVPRNKNKKNIKKGVENIREAFQWGCQHFNPENFEESFIRELAGRVTPELYGGKIATYREDFWTRTRILRADYTPPQAEKVREREIPAFINFLRQQLKCSDVINRIETAISAHFHIARIHPFEDGNGRTARVLQDIILTGYNVPVPVIEAGERTFYCSLLDDAVGGWKYKEGTGADMKVLTDAEKRFYDFIAGRVNVSLDRVLKGAKVSIKL